jgi:putative colanic acid biosynthesis acetyltransferase WcaF
MVNQQARNVSVDLSSYTSAHFDRGAGKFRESLWLMASLFLFRLCPFSLSPLKRIVLRAFGAKIGRGVVIKPDVKITFPWKLEVGDFVWLGEQCWLLNLDHITIASNVCISQRAFLCTGNHNYRRSTFDLIVKPIIVAEGVWLGAGCWVGPGVKAGSHSVLTAGSVVSNDMESWGIYQGIPAVLIKRRTMETGQFMA